MLTSGVVGYYEGVSISNQPDIFLTGRHSQDFHRMFRHHIKTYVQSLSIIGSLVDNLLRPQARPVSQMKLHSSN